ncbi:MAG TPA: hypothetical protein VM597_15765 [Gemmataceae bacterium]|jgi:hypothetical protein|nr:hypothetical protein [Gemmataceae bacterium]
MSRALVLVALVAAAARADAPRFRFATGETLSYHLVQTTQVVETAPDEKTNKPVETKSTTKVDLIRKWKVSDVDAKGVATVEMTIAEMRWERKSGDEEDVFDSSKPDDLNKSEMAKHVGPVLAVLRVDPLGKVVEVKESKVGPAARFETELPFKFVLPATTGPAWDRTFTLQLDPPLGTGEKYATTQKYQAGDVKNELLPVRVATEIKDLPATSAEQIPLLPHLAEGTVYFHAATGRYYAARLKVQKELKNHQGDGSSYKFTSTYVEDLVLAK